MNVKTNYTLVGGFILTSLIMMILFVMWIAKLDVLEDHRFYNMYFEESITGLSTGSIVRYHGVPAGVVDKITINPDNVDQIVVRVKINEGIPIKEDVHASLEVQGITGIRFILIEGGKTNSQDLIAKGNEQYPVIPVKVSKLNQVFETVPQTLARISSIVEKFDNMFSKQSQTALTQMIKNLNIITASIAKSDKDGENIIDEARHLAVNLQDTLRSLAAITLDWRKSTQPSLSKMFAEATEMFGNLTRSIESINRSPQRFLANDPSRGRRVQ